MTRKRTDKPSFKNKKHPPFLFACNPPVMDRGHLLAVPDLRVFPQFVAL
jgi:hypothetical protein